MSDTDTENSLVSYGTLNSHRHSRHICMSTLGGSVSINVGNIKLLFSCQYINNAIDEFSVSVSDIL
jgi:hypothetical protein